MDFLSICLGLGVGILLVVNQQIGVKEDKKKRAKAEQEAKNKKQQQLNNRVIKCPHCKEYIIGIGNINEK